MNIPRYWIHSALALFLISLTATAFDPDRFEKEILVANGRDALQFEVLSNGDIVFAEFHGGVKQRDAKTGAVTTLGKIETHAKGEVGLLGMAVAPDFLKSGHLYLLYCPLEKQGTMRVSRFTVKDGKMPLSSEKMLLDWPYDTEHVFHMGGAMCMNAKGDLFIGNGDNCHWKPGLPVDTRRDMTSWDAFRSAGNTRDLRGKILRIHPEPDGAYTTSEDNLFPEGKDGAQEIFAMGIRNPFRISFDDQTGTLYIGDVGPNIMPVVEIEPAGYEEIIATRTAGNFGWPSFIGPNEPLPFFDFEKNKVTGYANPKAPINPSPRNTGIRKLPPARPALIWYSTLASKRFPTLGSGGRSIMAGPVYHFDENNPSKIMLPKELDGRLFIYEWMRNWIQTVKLDTPGPEIEPFLSDWNLRRPIDMRIGPDGALYLIEYGDRWWENTDSRIVRIVYRRGNRPPVAQLAASETAGKQPLTIRFDASGSTDPDGGKLKYEWSVKGAKAFGRRSKASYTFKEPGSHEVVLRVTDVKGAASETRKIIDVGNARPIVNIDSPAHGSFFDWGSDIPYRLSVVETDGDDVYPKQAAFRGEFRPRRFSPDGQEAVDPGLALMRSSTCFSCHASGAPSAGPAYKTVALKYADDPTAASRLAQKILSGGAGVWGQIPMPPHPQHTLVQTRQMVNWVLSLKDDPAPAPKPGISGVWKAPRKPTTRITDGVLILTADYTDDGKEGTMRRLRGESTIVLHSRRKKAALYDENHGMQYVEQVEGETGILGHFEDGDHILFRDLNLDGIKTVTVRAGGLGEAAGKIELRVNHPQGQLLASVNVEPTGDGQFLDLPAKLRGQRKLTDICVVARFREPKDQVLGLNWIEFR